MSRVQSADDRRVESFSGVEVVSVPGGVPAVSPTGSRETARIIRMDRCDRQGPARAPAPRAGTAPGEAPECGGPHRRGSCPQAELAPERGLPRSGMYPRAGTVPRREVPQGGGYPRARGTPQREVPQSGICRRAFRNRLDSESGRLLTYITAPPQQLTPRNRSHRRSSG